MFLNLLIPVLCSMSRSNPYMCAILEEKAQCYMKLASPFSYTPMPNILGFLVNQQTVTPTDP